MLTGRAIFVRVCLGGMANSANFSKLLLCQTFLRDVNQKHVVVPLGAVFPKGVVF